MSVKIDEKFCHAVVRDTALRFGYKQCSHKKHNESDFCKLHQPESVEARRKNREARAKERYDNSIVGQYFRLIEEVKKLRQENEELKQQRNQNENRS